MAIYDYETLQETDPTEMERLKKKFAGNPPVNDSNYGLSRFQLTTYDGEVPVNLIGVLECYKAGITTFINFFNSF